MPLILSGGIIQALSYLPLFILPVLLPSGGMTALLLVVTVCFFSAGFAVPAWMSMMGDVVDPTDRGRYFSIRTRTIMCSMLVFMLLAGWIVNRWEIAGSPATGEAPSAPATQDAAE